MPFRYLAHWWDTCGDNSTDIADCWLWEWKVDLSSAFSFSIMCFSGPSVIRASFFHKCYASWDSFLSHFDPYWVNIDPVRSIRDVCVCVCVYSYIPFTMNETWSRDEAKVFKIQEHDVCSKFASCLLHRVNGVLYCWRLVVYNVAPRLSHEYSVCYRKPLIARWSIV